MSYEESGVVMKEKITTNVYEVEENEESWVDKFLKIFSFRQKNDEGLTAKKANMIARFGMPDDFDSIVKKKVGEIEQQIKSAFCFSVSTAFPIATPTSQYSIISKSFKPSPKAYVC